MHPNVVVLRGFLQEFERKDQKRVRYAKALKDINDYAISELIVELQVLKFFEKLTSHLWIGLSIQ